MKAERKTLETGYDIGKVETTMKLKSEMRKSMPKRMWFSLRCTAYTSIQNINQRTPDQIEKLRKKRLTSNREVLQALEVAMEALKLGRGWTKVYWEWPKGATAGWRLPMMQKFQDKVKKELNMDLYFTEIHGCMYGLKSPDGWPLKKAWVIMSNDQDFHYRCRRLCDGSHNHRPGTETVASTAYYPATMTDEIARCWRSQLQREQAQQIRPEVVESLQAMCGMEETYMPVEQEGISDDAREQVRQLLHRLHRAAGHPSNRALAKLCRDRGMSDWMIKEAMDLKCQACVETQKGGQMVVPVALGTKPKPWQVVGADVFELHFPAQKCKARYLAMSCMAMHFTSVQMTWRGEPNESGTDAGIELIQAEGWLLHRPRPEWVVVDSQTSLAAGSMADFLQSAGIGLTITPGEAHWQHGTMESMVRVTKNTMKRLRNEKPDIDPKACSFLAAHAENHHDKVKGYSPIQWAYGVDTSSLREKEEDPLDVNTGDGTFWDLQKMRDRAAEVHKQEKAKEKFTRLNNAAPRQDKDFKVGDWVCVAESKETKVQSRTSFRWTWEIGFDRTTCTTRRQDRCLLGLDG